MTRLMLVGFLLVGAGDGAFAQEGQTGTEEAEATGADTRVRRLGDSLAVDPNQEWIPSFDRSLVDRDLERKLAAAEQALEAGNIVAPADASAVFYLQQVLTGDADNEAAAAGLERAAAALLSRARAAADAGSSTAALARINEIRSFLPTYPGLATLEASVRRRDEISALLAAGAARLQAGDLLEPAGQSARDAYEAVVAIDAANGPAREGLAAVRDTLIDRALAAAAAGDLARAEALGAQAAEFSGAESLLAPVSEAIAAARAAALQARLAAVEADLAAGEIEAAEAALAALRGDGLPESDRTAAIDTAIARIRRLRAFPAGSELADRLAGGGDGPTMVVIPAGRFEMGSPRREDGRGSNEGPQREIAFAVPFALAKTEVTVAEFRRFIDATGYQTDAETGDGSTIYNVLAGSLKDDPGVSWRNNFQGQGADDGDPVVHVSWNDASAYAAWLAAQTGERYRLPSEAEFEYALRAGTSTPFWWGRRSPRDEVENLTGEDDRMAGRWEWPDPFDNYGDDYWGPAPVASFEPNPFGLFDAGGNVMEWVADCYVSSLDDTPPDGAPLGGAADCARVLKGGSWATPPSRSRSAQRTSTRATRATGLVGFRVARDL